MDQTRELHVNHNRESCPEEAQSNAGQDRDEDRLESPPESCPGSDMMRESELNSDAEQDTDHDDDDDTDGSSDSDSSTTSRNSGKIEKVPPSNEMMEEHCSYHQSITAEEAGRRLRMFSKECCYLTRFSKHHKSYVLSLFRKQHPNDAIEHLGIVLGINGKYNVKGRKEIAFDSIEALLKHYEEHRISPGFPTIGQSYSEVDFNKHQKQLDDEKKKEQTQVMKLKEELDTMQQKLQEAEERYRELNQQREQEAVNEAVQRREATSCIIS